MKRKVEKYFPNPGKVEGLIDTRRQLLESLERINTYNPPVQTCSTEGVVNTGWIFNGLYTGPTSIAYLFYRLHLIYPDLEFKEQSLLDWAQAYLELSQHVLKPDPDPDHCGIANETLAFYALKAVILRDASLASKICSFNSHINNFNTTTSDGSNEWLYGRAGYLYFLRLLSSVFTTAEYPVAARQLAQTIQKTVSRILSTPLPWIWYGSEYLGAAHGTIGIIVQLVLSDPNSATQLTSPLEDLLDQQLESGNFPASPLVSSGKGMERDELVQFCHGGPGFVISLECIRSYFPGHLDLIDRHIARAREDIWRRGLLTKPPSLCHGIAGNALALDTWDDINVFLACMTSEKLEETGWMEGAGSKDDFVGLFAGEAGRAWVWAVADQKASKTCIGYNDL